MNKTPGPRRYWKTQLPVDYLDASLTQNLWETVDLDLSDGEPAKLWWIIVEQTNDGAAVETIELEITINGTAYTWTLTGIASGTPSYCFFAFSLAAGDFNPVASTTARTCGNPMNGDEAVPFCAESVGLIRVRQTTGVDPTAAQIEVNIVWEKLVS